MEVLKKNSSGGQVADLQRRLKLLGYDPGPLDIDGVFGPETENAVRKFQQNRGLVVSGMVDQETWQELVDAGYMIGDRLLYLKEPPFRGDDVRTLQLWLKTLGFYPYNENGIFCGKTQRALLAFQKDMHIADDGIAGEETLRYLKNLGRIIVSKENSNFPSISGMDGKKPKEESRIILDYNPVTTDGARITHDNPDYCKEKLYICGSIIDYAIQYLEREGLDVHLTADSKSSRESGLTDRISNANKSGADLLISINLNHSADKDARGCSSFYFKGLRSYSLEGHKLANIIQDIMVAGLGTLDCRVHGAGYAILKETVMTSVLVEPGFISNEAERKKLRMASSQKIIAEGITCAVLDYLKL
ncbi:MAG: peptidoglycan-binding protein [Actinobacteria bacterium]|nr:peptidoglycan-binding protein [Actinomycetota bacterium]